LRTMVRLARSERHLALSPDGPRGPRGRFKAGALLVARETGAVVVPMAVGASAGWHLRSWDGFLVPRPGSRVTVEYLEPVHVPADARRADLERMAREIETRINERTDVLGRTGWTPAEVRA